MSMIHHINTICVLPDVAVSARLDGRLNTNQNVTCFSGFAVYTSGLEYEYNASGSVTNSTTWLDRGDADQVWITWNRTGGTLSDWNNLGGGNNGTRLQITTNRLFRLNRTTTGFNDIIGYCTFHNASTGGRLMQTTSTVTWRATYQFEGCPLCCFTPDTLITMADGKLIPIKSIRKGDKILVGRGPYFDEEEVDEIIIRNNRPMFRIHFDNGTVLEASEDHPLHVKGKGAASINPTIEYKDLGVPKKIEIGDKVSSDNDGYYTKIVKIEPIDYRGIVLTLGNSYFFANGICVY